MFTQDDNHESIVPTISQFSSDNVPNSALDETSSLIDATALKSKKRKRNENSLNTLLDETFVVKPYPAKIVPTNPWTLQPVLLVRRSDLPLSSLDFSSSAKSLGQTRLFEAHLKVLELEEQVNNQQMILIARHKISKALFALERESQGLYALFQLGSWVNLQHLLNVAVAIKQNVSGASSVSEISSSSQKPQPQNLTGSNVSSKKRIAIQAIQSKIRRSSNFVESPSRQKKEHPLAPTKVPLPEKHLPHNEGHLEFELAPSNLAETSETIRTQYFEILYRSKASLAYFAKGPLSRARAMFLRSGQPNDGLSNHILFLESLIMTISHLDKKFKFGIPLCISSFDDECKDTDNRNANDAINSVKKTSRKIKRNKNGLYPGEEKLIHKWWSINDDDFELSVSELSADQHTKTRISQLRTRETQLQILLILEVLALRPFIIKHDLGENLDNNPLTTSNQSILNYKEAEEKRSKRKSSLSLLIDLHVDRLCIWQSVALEPLDSITIDSHKSTVPNEQTEALVKYDENALIDFCTDVIVPFFSSRLPNQCALINSKLGGPVVPSSSKIQSSKLSKPPGAITERRLPKDSRRTHKHANSNNEANLRGQRKVHGTSASVKSSSPLPTLAAIRKGTRMPSPINFTSKAEALEANRSGVFRSKRFAQREVNFSSTGIGVDIKAKKEAAKASKEAVIESGLSHAISMLRKPNLQLAVSDLYQPAETRYISPSHLQEPKASRPGPILNGVQICATPKSHRSKVFPVHSPTRNFEPSNSSPTSPPLSPNTVHIKESQLYPIQVTPTKRPRQFISRDSKKYDSNNRLHPNHSLSSNNLETSHLFLSKKDHSIESRKIKEESCGIIDTPVKGFLNDISYSRSLNEFATNMRDLTCTETFNENIDNDIYDELGWNEDIT